MLHPQAKIALRAVKLKKQIGEFAARRYAEKRNCESLYHLTWQLDYETFRKGLKND